MPRSFIEWYYREVVAPFASELDRVHPEGKACVLMDGEPSQVMAIVGDPEQPPTALFHFLKQRGIIVVKLPASCSMLLQPADVMSLFKVMKKLLLGMGNEEWNLLYDNCLAPVMGHIRSLYAARKCRNDEMDTSNKRLIRMKAIASASYALRESLNQKQILAGFYLSGTAPLNIDRIFGRAKPRMAEEDVAVCKIHLEAASAGAVGRNGTVAITLET